MIILQIERRLPSTPMLLQFEDAEGESARYAQSYDDTAGRTLAQNYNEQQKSKSTDCPI